MILIYYYLICFYKHFYQNILSSHLFTLRLNFYHRAAFFQYNQQIFLIKIDLLNISQFLIIFHSNHFHIFN